MVQTPALVGCVGVCRLVKVDVHTLVGVQRRSMCLCVDTMRMCGVGRPGRLLEQEAGP